MRAVKLCTFLLCGGLQVAAQSTDSALPGTWVEKSDTLQETKVISPTHVFFMVQNAKTYSFLYAGAGTYSTNGDQYTEYLQYANFPTGDTGYTFTYKVDGNTFKQQGVMTSEDGTKENINHTFTRLQPEKAFNGPHVGTWNQLSSSFTGTDGTKGSHTNATHIRYQIISPTHWMRISMQNGVFENAFGGTYTQDGNKMIATIEFTSVPELRGATVAITQRVEGNKLYWSGTGKDAGGKQIIQFEDVFEKATVKK